MCACCADAAAAAGVAAAHAITNNPMRKPFAMQTISLNHVR